MPQELAQEFAQLRQQFIDGLAHHAHQLGQVWGRLHWETWDERGLNDLQQFLHKLGVTSANYGYLELSNAARYLATYLSELLDLQRRPGNNECNHIDEKIEALKLLMHNASLTALHRPGIHSPTSANQAKFNGQLIYVIDGDQGHASLVCNFLERAGFTCQRFASVSECLTQTPELAPEAIVLDADLHPEGSLAVIHSLKGLFAGPAPIILMSARTDLHTRLRALRAGCEDYLLKPLDFDLLLEKLFHSLRHPNRTYRVLIVDDDRDLAEFEAEVLRYAGMEVTCVDNPLKSLEKAGQFKPDLVLLDMHMPEINGLELAKLLRQDPAFVLLPIVFVTADTNLELHRQIQALGVNALLVKPIEPEQLIQVVNQALSSTQALKNRVARITQQSQQPHQLNSAYFFAAVDEEIHARRLGREQSALYYLSPAHYEDLQFQLDRIELSSLQEQFCTYLAQILGPDEHWLNLSPLVACVLAGRRSLQYHYQRGEQLTRHLSSYDYQRAQGKVQLEFTLGLVGLEPSLGNVHRALLAAESAFDLECGQKPITTADSPEDYLHIPQLNDKLDNSEDFSRLDLSQLNVQQDLTLAYQPIISLEAEHIEHFEVLVRLHLDNGEQVSASQFIHQLESAGKRQELDRWVLQQAVSTLAENPNIREEATLFIHLARETLEHKSFFSLTANVLHASRLRGSGRLVFMLEEPWVEANPQKALLVAKALLDIDCGLCLTQAGSTASCGQIIRQLPLHYLRLSPKLTHQAYDPILLKDILATARQEQIQVIATQIEDSRNLSSLWMAGVRLFEGFFIQAPDSAFHLQNDLVFTKEFVEQGRY